MDECLEATSQSRVGLDKFSHLFSVSGDDDGKDVEDEGPGRVDAQGVAAQVRAIAEASAKLLKAGKHPHAEVMVPLVGTARELEPIKREAQGE